MPSGEATRVQIELVDEPRSRYVDAGMERLRDQQERLRALRPRAARWISAQATGQALSIFGAAPATISPSTGWPKT
jgi:hypothetical protein